jgi:hypothetical protein
VYNPYSIPLRAVLGNSMFADLYPGASYSFTVPEGSYTVNWLDPMGRVVGRTKHSTGDDEEEDRPRRDRSEEY